MERYLLVFVLIAFAQSFELKLVRGGSLRVGVVFAQYEQHWGPVCGLDFGQKEADVACRQLGYTYGSVLCCAPYGNILHGHHMVRDVSCQGNETRLDQCWYAVQTYAEVQAGLVEGRGDCDLSGYATVVCHPYSRPDKTELTLSLAEPESLMPMGELRVTWDGVMGSVCADGWGATAAALACRRLGHTGGTSYTHYKGAQRSGGPYWTSNVVCPEDAEDWNDCDWTELGHVESCLSGRGAGVLCFNETTLGADGNHFFRLEGDAVSASSGRVGVWLGQEWANVYQGPGVWRDEDAAVLCRSMGFSSGVLMGEVHRLALGPADHNQSVWMFQPGCEGHENILLNCAVKQQWRKTALKGHVSDLAVNCSVDIAMKFGSTGRDGVVHVRAATLSELSGVADINVLSLPVCYRNFDANAANVVCREMGYPGGGVSLCCGTAYGYIQNLVSDIHDARGHGMVAMTTTCNGSEARLQDCVGHLEKVRWEDCQGRVGLSYMPEPLYAAVSCFQFEPPTDSDYLLTLVFNDVFHYYYDYFSEANYNYDYGEDFDYYYDIVQQHNESWGAVSVEFNGLRGRLCWDDWSDAAAAVACKEMGFQRGQAYNHYSGWSQNHDTDIIWSSHFNCTGEEDQLYECEHDGWGHVQQCVAGHSAGVMCYNEEGLKYRLNSAEPGSSYGRVELLLPGSDEWAALCSTWFWDNKAATVTCRMFGYSGGEAWPVLGNMPPLVGPVYERDEDCNGTEGHLDHCSHTGFTPAFSETCISHLDEAGVWCHGMPHGQHNTTETPNANATTTPKITTMKSSPTTTQTKPTTKAAIVATTNSATTNTITIATKPPPPPPTTTTTKTTQKIPKTTTTEPTTTTTTAQKPVFARTTPPTPSTPSTQPTRPTPPRSGISGSGRRPGPEAPSKHVGGDATSTSTSTSDTNFLVGTVIGSLAGLALAGAALAVVAVWAYRRYTERQQFSHNTFGNETGPAGIEYNSDSHTIKVVRGGRSSDNDLPAVHLY